MLGVVEHAHVDARAVASASTKAAIGPLPVPAIVDLLAAVGASWPRSWSMPSSAPVERRALTGVEAAPAVAGLVGGQVLVLEASATAAAGDTSPPSESVPRWTTLENSICRRRGRSRLVLGLEEVGDAALAGLAVDPDDGLVGAADVVRVDRQVGHAPDEVVDARARPPWRRRSMPRSPS